MGSHSNNGNDYDHGEYSDDFEPFEDAEDLDDASSSQEVRVFRNDKGAAGPMLTVIPKIPAKKPKTYEKKVKKDQGHYVTQNQETSRSVKKSKRQEIPKYERSSNTGKAKGYRSIPSKNHITTESEKNRQALMVVSRQHHNETEDDEDGEGARTSNDGNSEESPRVQRNQNGSRKTLSNSQVKKLARAAHMTESYQSMTLRIGGFRKTYGSNTSNTFSKFNHGKIQPYTPLPPMKLGFAKPFGTVSQRVLSAKRMTINDLKNKIKELQIEMTELRKENSALKHIEHRHKMALRKWEGREAELPRLMEQHKEELKNANTHVKKLSQQCRELETKLKQRDKKINGMDQELQKLRHLCSEAELEERQNLQTELDIVSANLCGAEKRLIQNKRHMEILEKNHQHQIQVEKQKLITANNHAMELQFEIMNLKQALRDKDRVLNYVQMKGSGRKLIRSFHEDERKSSTTQAPKYSVRKHKSDTTTGNASTRYDPSSFSKLGSWT